MGHRGSRWTWGQLGARDKGQSRITIHHNTFRGLTLRGLGAETWGQLGTRDKGQSHITIHYNTFRVSHLGDRGRGHGDRWGQGPGTKPHHHSLQHL